MSSPFARYSRHSGELQKGKVWKIYQLIAELIVAIATFACYGLFRMGQG
ncbi:hypothetical protein [Calothrix sp. 336/3]|nr:hypothetical protein [Calothrix sp. 336/3]